MPNSQGSVTRTWWSAVLGFIHGRPRLTYIALICAVAAVSGLSIGLLWYLDSLPLGQVLGACLWLSGVIALWLIAPWLSVLGLSWTLCALRKIVERMSLLPEMSPQASATWLRYLICVGVIASLGAFTNIEFVTWGQWGISAICLLAGFWTVATVVQLFEKEALVGVREGNRLEDREARRILSKGEAILMAWFAAMVSLVLLFNLDFVFFGEIPRRRYPDELDPNIMPMLIAFAPPVLFSIVYPPSRALARREQRRAGAPS